MHDGFFLMGFYCTFMDVTKLTSAEADESWVSSMTSGHLHSHGAEWLTAHKKEVCVWGGGWLSVWGQQTLWERGEDFDQLFRSLSRLENVSSSAHAQMAPEQTHSAGLRGCSSAASSIRAGGNGHGDKLKQKKGFTTTTDYNLNIQNSSTASEMYCS